MKAEDFTFFHDNMWDYEFQLPLVVGCAFLQEILHAAVLVGQSFLQQRPGLSVGMPDDTQVHWGIFFSDLPEL